MKNIPDEGQLEQLLENVPPGMSAHVDESLFSAPWTRRAVSRARIPSKSCCTTAITARSGMCVSCGRCTTTRFPPMRAAMRSISAASSSLSWTWASRSRCSCTTISVRLAAYAFEDSTKTPGTVSSGPGYIVSTVYSPA